MRKHINIDKNPILRGKDRIPFEKINAKLISLGWDSSIEYEDEYGWHLLAMKDIPSWGLELRKIKPFKITSIEDLSVSLKLQVKLKSNLVEVIPYKTYKGTRTFFPEITDFMDFMSEAKFPLFRKFFRTSDSSLEGVDKSEANESGNV